MRYTEIGDDIILWEIVGRLEIAKKKGNYTLTLYDMNNKYIIDIGYSDECLGESYRNEFIEYLMEK